MSDGLISQVGRGITWLRNFTFNTLFLLLLLFLVIATLSTCEQVSVPENSALVVNPSGTIVEKSRYAASFMDVLTGSNASSESELEPLLAAIEVAAKDDRIKMLFLDLEEVTGVAPAHARRLGQALQSFKERGKEIVAYGDYFSQSQYHLASFADAVYMHPQGQLILSGFGGNSFYYKSLLEKLRVNVHVFRQGSAKSAVEPYIRDNMSDEARMAADQLYQELWRYLVEDVARNRRIADDDVQDYADNIAELVVEAKGDLARVALEHHLIDELITPDQVRERIASKVGYVGPANINGVDYLSYTAATESRFPSGPPNIGVITVQGPITLNSGQTGFADANTVVDLIRGARLDDQIKAIVLRVDSPGGSQFASELIRQELELAELSGKPVVASFGPAAASGGYWIAATAAEIVSEASSITGSIGIFSVLTTFEDSLAEIGVYSDGVGTSEITRGLDSFAGVNDDMAQLLQSRVDNGYRQFVNLVIKGRKLPEEQVLGLADGRVWSGEDAKELGLVDHIGGLQTALERAAELADLDAWQPIDLLPAVDPREAILNELLSVQTLPAPVAQIQSGLSRLGWFRDPNNLHLMCTICVQPSHDPSILNLRQ